MEIIDLGLWFDDYKTLIIGDFHLGYEEALNKQGLMIPRMQFDLTIKRLEKIFLKVKPLKIVINGDLKHEFGTISDTEWKYVLRLIDYLFKHCNEIILVRGNHDTILEPIASKKNLEVVDYYQFGDNLVCHGDKILHIKSKRIIIGHEHPALTLKKGVRVEKYKCFLFGKWKDKELIVMPSFNLVKEGADILSDKMLSPYLTDINDFSVKVVQDEEILDFGLVKNLKTASSN